MIIKKVNIKGFGKLIDKEIEFSNRLNVVYGGNESGKTSLHAFLTAMLFGAKVGRTSDSALKRYRPWRGSFYGGTVTYSLDNGEVYRLERDFEAKTFKVFDSQYKDISGNMVEKNRSAFNLGHVGVTAECFDGTFSVKQGETVIESTSSESLSTSLANINCIGASEVSFKEAERALRDAMRENIGTDRTFKRPLDKLNNELESLKTSKEQILKLQSEYKKSKIPYLILILAILLLPLALLSLQLLVLPALLGIYYFIEMRKGWEKAKKYDEYAEQIEGMDQKIKGLEAKRKKLLGTQEALYIALEAINSANIEVSQGFTSWLNGRIGDVVGEITSGSYSDLRADKELNLKVLCGSEDMVVPIENLSRGTIEQAFFALRFAAGGALQQRGEAMPLIMDEPFAYYDDQRTQNTFELLKREFSGRQIIFFTCKAREVEIAAEIFGDFMNIIELN